MNEKVKVLLPLPVSQPYTYRVAAPWEPGFFVEVLVGNRKMWGVILEADAATENSKNLKSVLSVYSDFSLSRSSLQFISWVSQYTLAPAGLILKMVVPVPKILSSRTLSFLYAWNTQQTERLTPPRKKIKHFFQTHPPHSLEDLKKKCGIGMPVLKGMVAAKILQPVACALEGSPFSKPVFHPSNTLSAAQKRAVAQLKNHTEKQGFSATLLEGVTGSGKTEIYFDAIARTLEENKQVLILLPEIALTTQWLERFQKRFQALPAVWHGDLTPSLRVSTWKAVVKGQVGVIVGARSALFLPYPRLGLIIVDEEHDASFKQEEGVLYQGRDLAVARAYLEKIPVFLVSATPSLETLWNVAQKRYGHVQITDRYQACLPTIHLIDRRLENKQEKKWISPLLQIQIQETLNRGEQALLYLNRRGYAPLMICIHCRVRLTCKTCSAWLVLHKNASAVQCHHCGYTRPCPSGCAHCGSLDPLVPCGPGVERVLEEAEKLFPHARCQVMSRDTLSSPEKIKNLVTAMETHQIDILIGTQMVAKGHHFPSLTCVGVIDGDLGLSGSDLRACEKTYQLLHQVAGRAGRAHRPGCVFLQTFFPDHPVLKALLSHHRDDFVREELADRQANGLPPFGRLAALILSGRQKNQVQAYAHALARAAPSLEGVAVWGPIPAPLELLRGQYRWRLLVKAKKKFPLQDFLRQWLSSLKKPSAVRLQIDIDPYRFL